MVDLGAVQQLLATWWFNYDEGNFSVLEGLLTHDTHFTCRSDTGETAYEEFIRADVRGRDEVMAWQTGHRRNSPYPLRHNATNVHVIGGFDGEAAFASYIFVTHIVDGTVANLSSGICTGAVREEGGAPRLAALEVVLDTMDSDVFTARPAGPSAGEHGPGRLALRGHGSSGAR
jgi:hypothetical protein